MIKIVTAGAGTGKTYYLAKLLNDEVGCEAVRPDAIVATTFTKKAAAELENRVRQRLLRDGQVDQAQRLGASRIGTVNSVCGQLVTEFAFELGCSPSLGVLDEHLAQVTLRQSLARVVDKATQEELADLKSRMELFDWQAAVEKVLSLARPNHMSSEQIREQSKQSVESFRALLRRSTESAEEIEQRLEETLVQFCDNAWEQDTRHTKKTAGALRVANGALNRLQTGRALRWSDWARLANLNAAVKVRDLKDAVCEAAAVHDTHPKFWADTARAIQLVHEIAADGLEAYEDHKRALGVIDFIDQEVFALELLKRPKVVEFLRDETDLVLVDEFQDTSPLQLAIFIRLSELARRSVWVGDVKQSIYGFRGTDPALLDRVIETLEDCESSETLSESWRSRPELVEVTSNLFAKAFSRFGLDPAKVSLKPAKTTEPDGLGPCFEWWRLVSKNIGDDARAMAALIRELINDPSVNVREGRTPRARELRHGDVAVLCRTNAQCQAVAKALETLGVDAVLPRMGLMSTPEAITVQAALQLFVDPGDSLALARLSRLISTPDEPERWLDVLLEQPRAEAFQALEEVKELLLKREELASAGALETLDIVMEAIDSRKLCHRWGDTGQRLANLDRLRAHAVAYETHRHSLGSASTAAGLVTHLQRSAEDESDAQAVAVSSNAINVLTWHGAKGLEWPVVVLAMFDRIYDRQLGVKLKTDDEKFDVNDPLSNRWIRYWPNPYGRGQSKQPFFERIEDLPGVAEQKVLAEEQMLRLLYVGWTRAKDRLILAGRGNMAEKSILTLIADEDGPLVSEPGGEGPWCGDEPDVIWRCAGPDEPEVLAPRAEPHLVLGGPKEYAPARISPSSIHEIGAASEPIRLGERIPLHGAPDMARLGDAVHAFFAADGWEESVNERVQLAKDVLSRWGLAEDVQADDLVEASERLRRWIDESWPRASVKREWPIRHRLESGSVISGFVDLVIETNDGVVVIDHKTFPGGLAQAKERCAKHVGQLRSYATAVASAVGSSVVGCYIHLPITGLAVPVEST